VYNLNLYFGERLMYPLIGRIAPDFKAAVVHSDGSIENNYEFHKATKGKYSVLFFYPLDFTFVCPTELMRLNQQYQKLTTLNTVPLAISIDSAYVHQAWRNTALEKGGIGPVDFSMVADVSHHITRSYGVEHPEENVAYRATFVIDDEKVIWTQNTHNLPIGRNIDEIIRSIEAIQYFKEHGEVCPANWQQGQHAMEPSHEGVSKYLTSLSDEGKVKA
jgi:peroxiredoxin 2/4